MRKNGEKDAAEDVSETRRACTDAEASAAAVTPSALLQGTQLDKLDARVLLCHALGWHRTALITRADLALNAAAVAAFRALEQRRLAGEPVAQLVGEREFFGRRFALTPDVLIPRPDTELLVELALEAIDRLAAAASRHRLRALDLGTGSGAIALTLAAERRAIFVVATDRSRAALAIAEHNARALLGADTVRIQFLQGDWFGALAADERNEDRPDRFDLIVSNPPYIAAGDPHLGQGDLRFEPRGALTDESDGLAAIRAIVAGASQWLFAGSPLMIEHGYDQGAAVRTLFTDAGWADVRTERDLGGHERVTLGFKTR